MEDQMNRLLEIQRLDLRLAEIHRLRHQLPQELEKLREQLRAERERLQQARALLEELKTRRRKRERELEVELERVRKAQARLFEVKTNKEYQALLKEIEAAKKANSDLEEEILLLMEEMDEKGGELMGLEQEVCAAERSIAGKQREIEERLAKLDSEEKKAREARQEVASQLDPFSMGTYERVAKSHGGVGVVRVDGGTCQGCFVSIPPQLYNEILKGEGMLQCPFCQRFLYHQPSSQEGREAGCG